jgi:cytochrome c553
LFLPPALSGLKAGLLAMKKALRLGFSLWLCAGLALEADAGDVKAGAIVAEKCQACHGLDGLSKIAEAPNIAGQSEQYLIKQLTAFKNGERQNEMMSLVAPDLSDKDIEDLASYYSGIEIKVMSIPGK